MYFSFLLICNCSNLQFYDIGSTAESRRSHLPGMPTSVYPNNLHLFNGNHEHENSPDPYLLGRLMGSSYANYPSAFSVTSKGVYSAATSRQGISNENKPTRGFNANTSTEAPIYVPGAYLVSAPINFFLR